MNSHGFNFYIPRSPLSQLDHPRDTVQLDYGPLDGNVAPPVSQLQVVQHQESNGTETSYRQAPPEEDGQDEDPESDVNLSQCSQLTDISDLSEDDASSSTVVGTVSGVDTCLTLPTQTPAPTQPSQWQQPMRTRTLRKEDTLMSIDAPTLADQVEDRMMALVRNLCNEVCNRQTQGMAEVQAAVRQSFLQTQRDLLDLKKEVVDLRLQLERLQHGY